MRRRHPGVRGSARLMFDLLILAFRRISPACDVPIARELSTGYTEWVPEATPTSQPRHVRGREKTPASTSSTWVVRAPRGAVHTRRRDDVLDNRHHAYGAVAFARQPGRPAQLPVALSRGGGSETGAPKRVRYAVHEPRLACSTGRRRRRGRGNRDSTGRSRICIMSRAIGHRVVATCGVAGVSAAARPECRLRGGEGRPGGRSACSTRRGSNGPPDAHGAALGVIGRYRRHRAAVAAGAAGGRANRYGATPAAAGGDRRGRRAAVAGSRREPRCRRRNDPMSAARTGTAVRAALVAAGRDERRRGRAGQPLCGRGEGTAPDRGCWSRADCTPIHGPLGRSGAGAERTAAVRRMDEFNAVLFAFGRAVTKRCRLARMRART